MAPMTGA
jgi:hypothetical protein